MAEPSHNLASRVLNFPDPFRAVFASRSFVIGTTLAQHVPEHAPFLSAPREPDLVNSTCLAFDFDILGAGHKLPSK